MGENQVKKQGAAPVPAGDDRSSRERIIVAAEDVFAQFGFDGTSLRIIASAAGVPVGLISYHYGSKSGVYRAVFEAHTPAVIEQRMAGLALARLENEPGKQLELIVKAVMVPMLGLRATERSSSFGTLLAREVGDPRSIDRGIVRDMLDPIAKAVMKQLAAVLPEQSEAAIHWIYHSMIGAMVYVMGDAGRISRLSNGSADPNDIDQTTTQLIAILLDGIRPRT